MKLPNNITKDHILEAIKEIDRTNRKDRPSFKFDLIHEGENYPPLLVVAIANRLANGEELPANFSRGGWASDEFKLLTKYHFEIKEKKDMPIVIIKENSKHIKSQFDLFKKSEDYTNRRKQEQFSEIAREVILNTLQSGDLTNKKLTGFIQIFKPSVSNETLKRYLKICIENQEQEDYFYNKYQESGERGFTEVGLSSIRDLSIVQLEKVKQFILSIEKANSSSEIKEIVKDFEKSNIPYVKYGIYSPWLYYLKPTICPIMNSLHKDQLRNIGWSGKYLDTIDIFNELKIILNEDDLGTIDWFFLENEQNKFLLKADDSTDRLENTQVMIYEIKSAANVNSEELFSDNKNYFYWNRDKFINLKIGDFVFIINTHSKYVLFTTLEKTSINVKYDENRQTTYFKEGNETFEVSGKYGVFVKLKIIKQIAFDKWTWKSLGSSEITYLLGRKVSSESAANNLERVSQLSNLFESEHKIISLLDNCKDELKRKNIKGYFPELNKFLSQSKTSELRTNTYKKKFQGLNVKVSFGQGNLAKIPWISFLGKDQTTSKGIYPVYLLYKEINILILAYGISEEYTSSKIGWDLLDNSIKISELLINEYNHTPFRYGDSFVFKAYDTRKPLNEKGMNDDLNEIIDVYNQIILGNKNQVLKIMKKEKFDYNTFYKSVKESGLFISKELCLRFTASLLAKPFVILTGLSGSGKTKLAQLFAMWMCEDTDQYKIISVGADWTNREPLLGFPNALKANEYVSPENKVLDLIRAANENMDKPYFLILDEMNLSHVERYFADFLSVMESKMKISLHSGKEEWNGVSPNIGLPKNLFIIGTVNIDETTYMFSPKVLDRANVIEFRVSANDMNSFLSSSTLLDINDLETSGANMGHSFAAMANGENEQKENYLELQNTLMKFFIELKKIGAEFGYRTASEINRFVRMVGILDPNWSMDDIIDAAIMQKLLPKVHGSRRKLEPILKTLGELCINNNENIDDFLKPNIEMDFNDKTKINYPISFEKILRMYRSLIDNGFTSYAEA